MHSSSQTKPIGYVSSIFSTIRQMEAKIQIEKKLTDLKSEEELLADQISSLQKELNDIAAQVRVSRSGAEQKPADLAKLELLQSMINKQKAIQRQKQVCRDQLLTLSTDDSIIAGSPEVQTLTPLSRHNVRPTTSTTQKVPLLPSVDLDESQEVVVPHLLSPVKANESDMDLTNQAAGPPELPSSSSSEIEDLDVDQTDVKGKLSYSLSNTSQQFDSVDSVISPQQPCPLSPGTKKRVADRLHNRTIIPLDLANMDTSLIRTRIDNLELAVARERVINQEAEEDCQIRINAAQIELQRCKEYITSLKSVYEKKLGEIQQQIDSDSAKHKEQLSYSTTQLSELREQLTSSLQQANQVKEENDTLQAELRLANNELIQLKDDLAFWQQKAESQSEDSKQVQSLRQELSDARQNISSLTEQLKSLKLSSKETLEELRSKEAECFSLNTNNLQLQSLMQKNEESLVEAKYNCTVANKQLKSSQQQLHKTKTSLLCLQQAHTRAQDTMERLHQEIAQLQKENANLRVANSDLTNQLQSLEVPRNTPSAFASLKLPSDEWDQSFATAHSVQPSQSSAPPPYMSQAQSRVDELARQLEQLKVQYEHTTSKPTRRRKFRADKYAQSDSDEEGRSHHFSITGSGFKDLEAPVKTPSMNPADPLSGPMLIGNMLVDQIKTIHNTSKPFNSPKLRGGTSKQALMQYIEWQRNVDKVINAGVYSESQKVDILRKALEPDSLADKWVRTYVLGNEDATYRDVQRHLSSRINIHPEQTTDWLTQFHTCQQKSDEKASTFVDRLSEIASCLKLSDPAFNEDFDTNMKQRIQTGLYDKQDRIQASTILNECQGKDWAYFWNRVQRRLELQEEDKPHRPADPNAKIIELLSSLTAQAPPDPVTSVFLGAQVPPTTAQSTKVVAHINGSVYQNSRCTFCEAVGHVSSGCPDDPEVISRFNNKRSASAERRQKFGNRGPFQSQDIRQQHNSRPQYKSN